MHMWIFSRETMMGGIELLFNRQKDIMVHSARGAVLDGVGYFHGHTWPAPELLVAFI